jgi:hypothetical protein
MCYIADIISRYEKDLQMIKQDGWAVQYVKEQTNEICVKAIEECPYSYQFINNMTEEMWRLAVKKDGRILYQIKDIELKQKLTREITEELYNL